MNYGIFQKKNLAIFCWIGKINKICFWCRVKGLFLESSPLRICGEFLEEFPKTIQFFLKSGEWKGSPIMSREWKLQGNNFVNILCFNSKSNINFDCWQWLPSEMPFPFFRWSNYGNLDQCASLQKSLAILHKKKVRVSRKLGPLWALLAAYICSYF